MCKKKNYVDLKQSQIAVFDVPQNFYGIGRIEITLEYHMKMKRKIPHVFGSAWFRKKGMDVKIRFHKFRIPVSELEKDSYRGSLLFFLADDEEYLRRLFDSYRELNGRGISL